jgi:hypothetical protein
MIMLKLEHVDFMSGKFSFLIGFELYLQDCKQMEILILQILEFPKLISS